MSIDTINKKEYKNREGLSSYLSPYFIEKIEINREIEDINITKNRERASNLKEKCIKEDCTINSLLKQYMLKTVKNAADKMVRQLKKYLNIPLCLRLSI